MLPYDDTDLIALARARGLLTPQAKLPLVANGKGQLAPALVRAGLLDMEAIQPLLRELARHAQECPSCGARFCALPAAQRQRGVRCPSCEHAWSLAPSEGGLPAEAWTGSFAAVEATQVDRTHRAKVDDTLRDTTARGRRGARSNQAHASKLSPS